MPGVDRIAAWGLVAEMGINMEQFPSAKHAPSWGGVCPGNHESAGKRLGGRTRKGNPWLRRILGQSAWSAARTKNTYVAAQFRRLAAKRGRKRAIVAIGHSLLVTGYYLLRKQCLDKDLGADYFDRINAEGLKRYLVKRLESLGQKVTLEPRESDLLFLWSFHLFSVQPSLPCRHPSIRTLDDRFSLGASWVFLIQ